MYLIQNLTCSGVQQLLLKRPSVRSEHQRLVAECSLGANSSVSTDVARQHDIGNTRRVALLSLGALTALCSQDRPAVAAYGDAARVFAGKVTNRSGFIPYEGEGYALLLPSKWNPSAERDFDGVQLRYEDNAAQANNLLVLVRDTDKTSLTEFGSPEQFLGDFAYLFGDQSYDGLTQSEGGFAPNKVAAASLIEVQQVEKDNKTYYKYEILVRTADGDEGGKHQLLNACVSNGKLYLLKLQVGDKRWFKGANKIATGSWDSFTVV